MRGLHLSKATRCVIFLLVWLAAGNLHALEIWRAGAARVKITPNKPVWMSGYSNRTKPAEGTEHELWAKALALEDPAGRRAVLVTLDLVGIDRTTSLAVRESIQKKYGLSGDQVALNCSHTHCGPVVGRALEGFFFLNEKEWERIDQYTAWLQKRLVLVVGEAVGKLAPCTLAWGEGWADFAVNRRNNKHDQVAQLREKGQLKGPVDHTVPVLKVTDAAGRIIAIVFGYACHPTKLTVFYRWCGDYAGFAQLDVENAYPGAVAMFWQGCGGDQTPWPRGGSDVAKTEQVGRQLADAVRKVLSGPMTPITGNLASRYAEVELRLDKLPDRQSLEARASSENPRDARWAKRLLEQIDSGKPPVQSYPYPVQLWQLGSGPTFIMLGGEVVVDYALRLKAELGAERTWVAGYTNDVMAYIPSRRVLLEGGYEGSRAMIYYGLPSVWAADVEETIVKQVLAQAKSAANDKSTTDRSNHE